MRHAALNLGGALALLIAAAAVGAAETAAAPAVPAVLRSSAVLSKKAGVSAMLAVARAGSRLVAAGERGIVLLSDDGGANWRQAASVPVQTSLTALRFADQNNGWAVGHLGSIVHTADGGARWTLQLDGVRAAGLAAASLSATGQPGDLRTADQLRAEGPDKPFFDVDFTDSRHGYAVGAYNLAFATNDGGETWQPLTQRLPNAKSLHLYAVRARGEKVFIAGEQGLVLRSRDSGASFQALPSPYKGSFFGLLVTRTGTLLAYGLRGSLFRSSNDGADWQAVETGVGTAISSGNELDDGTLTLLTQNGSVLVSRDDGRTFQVYPAAASAPAAGLASAPDGALVLATLRGMRRQPTP